MPLLSKKEILNVVKTYTRRKAKSSSHQVYNDPSNPNGPGLKIPGYLCSFVDEIQERDTDYLDKKIDPLTGFEFTMTMQRSTFGDFAKSRGLTIQALSDQTEVGEILLVSEMGQIVRDKKDKMKLAKLNFFIYGGKAYRRGSYVMRINTRSIAEDGTVEIENCEMISMSGEILALELGLKEPLPGYYCVIRNKLPIYKGDLLIVRDYDGSINLPYGSDKYIEAQLKCYQRYKAVIAEHPSNAVICTMCFKRLPHIKNQRLAHNFSCQPYIWNFIPPKGGDKTSKIEESLED
jgi:hypothetical protein